MTNTEIKTDFDATLLSKVVEAAKDAQGKEFLKYPHALGVVEGYIIGLLIRLYVYHPEAYLGELEELEGLLGRLEAKSKVKETN